MLYFTRNLTSTSDSITLPYCILFKMRSSGFEVPASSVLIDFYGLKTLQPLDYQNDSRIDSSIDNIDFSTITPDSLPKDLLFKLLSDDKEPSSSDRVSKSGRNYSDPLGFHKSVLDELINKDIIASSRDSKKDKFTIDSKNFNVKLFLRTIHQDKSSDQLIKAINYLDRDLDSKKPKLQELISNNFTKTLNTKDSLDKVFQTYNDSNLMDKVDILKTHLSESSSNSNKLLNPVLTHMSKEAELKAALKEIKQNTWLFNLNPQLKKSIELNDFNSIVENYKKGQEYYATHRNDNNPVVYNIWASVERTMDDYKKSLWTKLGTTRVENIDPNSLSRSSSKIENEDNVFGLITKIMKLGTFDNPIVSFINAQYEYLLADWDTGLAKIQYLRLLKSRENVLNSYNSSDYDPAMSLKRVYSSLTNVSIDDLTNVESIPTYDLPLVSELWNLFISFINDTTDTIINDKIMKFFAILKFFTEDFKFDSESAELNDSEKESLMKSFENLIIKVCSRLQFLFAASSEEMNQAIQSLNENIEPQLKPKQQNINSLDAFGFIPPHSNTISVLTNLIKVQTKLFGVLKNLQENSKSLRSSSVNNAIDSTLEIINVNIVNGYLCYFISDIKKLSSLENWVLSETFEGSTKMPQFLLNFYKTFILKINQLLLLDNSKKIMEEVYNQFLKSFDLLIEGQLKTVIVHSQNDPDSNDFYLMATLSNLSNLKLKVIPRILSAFDTHFGTKLSTSRLPLYPKLESTELKIYEEYLKDYKSSINIILGNGIRDTDWFHTRLPQDPSEIQISNFVLKALNLMNLLKAKLLGLKCNRTYILKIEITLINYIIDKLIDFLKEIQQFSSVGLLLITIDLRFLVRVLETYSDRKSTQYDTLNNVTNKFIKKNTADVTKIEAAVQHNLEINKSQINSILTHQ